MADAAVTFPNAAMAIVHSSPEVVAQQSALFGKRLGDIPPSGKGLVNGTRLEGSREDHWIAERARDGLRLRPDRGLLGDASQRP